MFSRSSRVLRVRSLSPLTSILLIRSFLGAVATSWHSVSTSHLQRLSASLINYTYVVAPVIAH